MEIEKETCAVCGYEMEPVRLGKHQCNHCEAVEFLEDRWHKSAMLAGELVAIIRVNAMRGTWAAATPQEVDEFLAPWIAKLREVQPVTKICPTNAIVDPRHD